MEQSVSFRAVFLFPFFWRDKNIGLLRIKIRKTGLNTTNSTSIGSRLCVFSHFGQFLNNQPTK